MIVVLFGMMAGLGVWLVARGWRPAAPTLETAVAGLSRPSPLARRSMVMSSRVTTAAGPSALPISLKLIAPRSGSL